MLYLDLGLRPGLSCTASFPADCGSFFPSTGNPARRDCVNVELTSFFPVSRRLRVRLHQLVASARSLSRHGGRGRILAAVASDTSSSSVGDERRVNPVLQNPGLGEKLPAAVQVRPVEKGKKRSVLDYMQWCPELSKPDGGPPRWFSPLDCGSPPKNAPLLLFLPGMDGAGSGLIVHYQSLGRLFELRCLHIPIMDRTPFEGLVKFVEDTVQSESRARPQPIYIVGDSFGGCLALSVAARNPDLDIVLLLVNPATSFERSQLQVFLPLLEILPSEAVSAVPFLLSFIMGDPIRMAMLRVDKDAGPLDVVQQLSNALVELLPTLPALNQVLPRDTLLWKLQLLRAGARYANSRLHAVTAQVLVLSSGKDQMLPSLEEGKRLQKAIPSCTVRVFPDSGHTLLLESGLNLATVFKSSSLYRFSRDRTDYVRNFVPPTPEETEEEYQKTGTLRKLLSPVFFSTLEDGRVVKGLPRIPNERVVLYVGNHAFMGLDLSIFVGEFAIKRGQFIRGLAHPMLFPEFASNKLSDGEAPFPIWEQVRLFGAAPVSGKTMYSLFQEGSSVLLYPGGAREAVHRKGEAYKLFWPEKSEFVRMAARFGAIIVPFGVVGEDEIFELLLDLDELRRIPVIRSQIDELQTRFPALRTEGDGELADQPLHMPVFSPKLPGRLYTMFGKPIDTRDMPGLLHDRKRADEVYKTTKKEVENAMAYLLEKRKEDPYREFIPRILYETSWGGMEAPSFEP